MGYKDHTTDRLVKAILRLKDEKECYALLEDLCTVKEILDMSQRLDVAVMLADKMNYQQIAQKSGASTATISRVNKCYMYGTGGYTTIIERIKDDER